MRPHSPGTRVHLADLGVGDVIDLWHKRSGGFFLREDITVIQHRDNGEVLCERGIVLLRDTNWGEIRLKSTPQDRNPNA